jgi:predicted permease
MLFSVLGGILGVLLTLWALRGIEYLGLDALPRGGEIALDWAAVVYSFLLVSIVGVIIGLWPTLSMRWSSLAQVIRAEGRSGMQSRGTRTTQRILVAAQVALALVMLIGAGLLLASFERVLAVDLGFRPEPVLTGSINLPNSRYPGRPEMLAVTDRVLTQLKALPGVTAVGLTTSIPLGGTYSDAVIVPEGYQSSTGESLISPSQVIVSEGYFEAIGATLLAGRFIDARDSEMAPRAIVIDDALARKFWPNADPIGRRMYYPSSVDLAPPPEKEWLTVVGVVKGIRLQAIDDRALTGLFGAYFLPYRQFPSRTMTLAVKTSRDAANATRTVRDVITRVDSELVFYDVQTMERIVDRALVGRRTPMILAVAFAAVALALAAIGIYGVISYSVTQRSREIGLRLALGAQPTDVLRRVIGEGMRLVIVGLVLGLLASFSLAQLVSNLLYEVTPTDPTTVAGACVLALLISFIASFIPARRAARVDPLVALRYE